MATDAVIPELPPWVTVWRPIDDRTGLPIPVITVEDAARLVHIKVGTLEKWIGEGKVAICYTPTRDVRVLVASLWAALPAELKEP